MRAEARAPEHRRLRFSFQNQQCQRAGNKRHSPSFPAAQDCPEATRGALYMRQFKSCQTSFSDTRKPFS